MTNASEPHTDRELLLNINSHVIQLSKDMDEVKSKLGNTIDTDFYDRQHVDITKKLLDHGKRIGGLENWRWYILGGFSVAVVIIESLVQLLRK